MTDSTTFAHRDNSRVYLDNAATSWPKPEAVYQAVDGYQRELGVAAGRGSYRDAQQVHRSVSQCRLSLAQLLNAESAEEIVFTQNCTDALNLAIHGLLQPEDLVLTSNAEHNSVLRPLRQAGASGVQMKSIPATDLGQVDLQQLEELLQQQQVRLVAINHVSNVTGVAQPLGDISALTRKYDSLLLVDAAQSLGHESVDVQTLGIDMLAAAGHKGLLGPLGTGLLFIRRSLHSQVASIRQGGTGSESELPEQPATAPHKYESGNLNVPGIVGLEAGVKFVQREGTCHSEHLQEITERTVTRLADIPEVRLFAKPNRYGIVSFLVQGYDPAEVAVLLDNIAQVQVRAGLHCAPDVHRALGTIDVGGTVRASFGHFSKPAEADTLCSSIEALVGQI